MYKRFNFKFMVNKFEGYTGKIAESEVLGETTPEEKEREKEFSGEYISFKQAVDLVKESGRQPFKDPTNPEEKPFPHDLHATIVEMLSLVGWQNLLLKIQGLLVLAIVLTPTFVTRQVLQI